MAAVEPHPRAVRLDPRRTAILLIGGDKRHRWDRFYEEMVPVADDLYDGHLAQLAEEGWIG